MIPPGGLHLKMIFDQGTSFVIFSEFRNGVMKPELLSSQWASSSTRGCRRRK